MNNDELALYSFMAFLLAWVYLFVAKVVIEYLCQFRVVRTSLIENLYKQLSELEFDNDLLRQGILITADKNTGQIKFDLPAFEQEYYYLPFQKNGTLWYQCWRMDDWIKHQNGLVFVKRGKKNYLWVEEPLKNDHIIDQPFEWIKQETNKVVRKNSRRKKQSVVN